MAIATRQQVNMTIHLRSIDQLSGLLGSFSLHPTTKTTSPLSPSRETSTPGTRGASSKTAGFSATPASGSDPRDGDEVLVRTDLA